MIRQPFRARFRSGSFDFTLLSAHTSPSINLKELEGLEKFFRQVEESEDDVIVLGDLNADCDHLKEYEQISFRDERYNWIFDDDVDTTVARTHCAYDRFIMTETIEDYTGTRGRYFKVPENISEHYVIWAEFSTTKDTD